MPHPTSSAELRSSRLGVVPPPAAHMRRLAFACNNCTGLELFRGSIIRQFLAAGFEVHVIAPYDTYTPTLIAAGVRFTDIELSHQGMNPVEEMRTVRALRRAYRRLAPDLIFQYTIKINVYGTYAARALGIPTVCIVPGLGSFPEVANTVVRYCLSAGYAYAARHSAEMWFLNQHDYGFFESRGWLDGVTSRILPGEGVNVRDFTPTPLPDGPVCRVLFIGRLLETKGVRVFAEVATLMKAIGEDFHFSMIGYLEEHNPAGISAVELQTWIDAGVLEYHGAVPDVRPFIGAADVIVLPTHFREGLNRVIQEAMACGRPVVTTNVPGAGELVSHESTGYIVPVRNAAAIVEVLRYHATLSGEQREGMGRLARRQVVQRYDERFVHGHYFDLVARLGAARLRRLQVSVN